jgi:LysM repeat protein
MSPLSRFSKWWCFACLAAVLAHNLALPSEAHAQDKARATHAVQPGESLSVIAEQQGVSLALLCKVNGLQATDTIRPGQVLLLPRLHKVKPGDVLGTIAERYGVKLSALYRHNDLNNKSVLRVGQQVIIPGGSTAVAASTEGVGRRAPHDRPRNEPAKHATEAQQVEYYRHKVRRKEVLSNIARRYSVSTQQLCQLNQLSNASLIRVGQRLKIPVNDRNAHLTRPKPWQVYARRRFERGAITLQTLGGKWSGRVLDQKGNILPDARKRIQSLLASWETGRKVQIALNPRLFQLIVKVSDEFGGRPIRVVSGYRERSFARHSKHRTGRALDFSIPGVPNSALIDFLITLPKTGVGYYPNSTHVHMDARSTRMYWVDVSGPGQAPRYVHKSASGERAPIAAFNPHRSPSGGTDGVRVARLGSP